MADISDKRIAILATDGFEQAELTVPKQRLEKAGAKVDIISLKTGEIWGWDHDDWGEPIEVDRTIDAVNIDEYDALVIPGGVINPDLLRQDEDAWRWFAISMRVRNRLRRSATLPGCSSKPASSRGAR
jgi:protease I